MNAISNIISHATKATANLFSPSKITVSTIPNTKRSAMPKFMPSLNINIAGEKTKLRITQKNALHHLYVPRRENNIELKIMIITNPKQKNPIISFSPHTIDAHSKDIITNVMQSIVT